MRAEQLSEAFSLLDDDIIEAVDDIRRNPAPVKRNRTRWIAMAACFCLLFTAAILSRSMFTGSDGSVEDIASNDGNDNITENMSCPLVTIPDYSFTKDDFSKAEYYDLSRNNDETLDDAEKQYSISGNMYLPIFQNMTLDSSIILVESIEKLENQLNIITNYKKIGQYPMLDISDAMNYLKNGKYITFVESKLELTDGIEPNLVYLYDKEADIAIPFYHFTTEDTANKEYIVSGWFVPAISDEYITNMPGATTEE